MCGLVASLEHDLQGPLAKTVHRGIRVKEMNGISHVRLPIVGLDMEFDQPIVAGDWTIAFVGELLNFRELHPGMQSDVELVKKTWEEKGPTGFRKFDGFWHIVARIGDGLFLLCDYLAQKPLYYRTDQASCASEPDACAAFGPVTPDLRYLSTVIKWGYCPDTTRTPYNEVKRVQPGELVYLTKHQPPASLGIVDQLTPRSSTKEELKEAIEKAVKRRVLSSDVPVACLLSGGLDSSIVYTLARRYGSVKAYYTVASDTARDMLEEYNVKAVVGDDEYVTEYWGATSYDDALKMMQEPLDLGSLVPQAALSDIVKERVCLTGDGADEMFGGYGRTKRYDSQSSDIWDELVNYHLPRLDRVMMANCIEVRSPFLARDVVEMAMGLPYSIRKDKKILRKLFRLDLPEGIADQAKIPLRTDAVRHDREANSIRLVERFKQLHWGN